MAYTINKNGDNTQSSMVELTVDSVSDIETLPTTYLPGSTCVVIDGTMVYMLGNDRVWHEL